MWWVDVEVSFFFFFFSCGMRGRFVVVVVWVVGFVVTVDIGWLVVLRIVGLRRKRETEERKTRKKKKNKK